MPNVPLEPRPKHSLRAPRYERRVDLAAFHLGYSPYQLWHEFSEQQCAEPQPECKRSLQDLPVMLEKWFTPYALQRYVATLDELLGMFAIQPPSIPVKKVISQPGKSSSSGSMDSNTPDVDVSDSHDDQPAALAELPETVEDLPIELETFDWPERTFHLFEQRISQVDLTGFALIRLANAIAEALPAHLQSWFRLGQTMGRCLSCLTRKYYSPDVDIRQEILLAAAGTDFEGDQAIPDVSHAAYPQRQLEDGGPASEGYFIWAYDCLDELRTEVAAYLMDEPSVSLHPEANVLWFLGTYVPLTGTECAVLAAIAQSEDDVVSREAILRKAVNEGHPLITSGRESDALRKADQWIIQILDKIVKELEASASPFFHDDKKKTRAWLREEFLPASHGVGWSRGPLFRKMTLK